MKKQTKKQPKPMTDGEQEAVAVARDVIAQLRARKFVATQGQYVTFPTPLRKTVKPEEDLRKAVGDRRCRVCQKGAFFIAALRRNDDLPVYRCQTWVTGADDKIEGIAGLTVKQYVVHQLGILSDLEFDQMEHAFESDYYWLSTYPKADDRMRAICRNVIRNRGHFVCDEVEAT